MKLPGTHTIRHGLTIALGTLLVAACAAPSPSAAPTSAGQTAPPTTAARNPPPLQPTQASAAAQSGQQVTISLSFIATGSEQMAPLIDDFQKANPNIKVNVQYLPQATLGQATVTALQAGNAARRAVHQRRHRPTHLGVCAGQGRLSDRSVTARLGQGRPRAAHDMYFDGTKLYGAPMGLSLVGVVYNTALFQQLGLADPFDVWRPGGPVGKGKAAGKTPMALAGQAPGLYAQAPAASTVYAANPNWNEDRAAGKVTFANTPGWQMALQEFQDLNKAGCFQDGASADTIVKAFQMLGNEQAVMFLAPSAAIGGILGVNQNFKAAMFPVPGPTPESTRAVTEYNDSFSVNAKSPNQEAALKLVDFLAQPDQQKAYAKIQGEISVPDSVMGTVPDLYSSFAPLLQQNKTVTLPSLIWPSPAVGRRLRRICRAC